MSWDGEITRIKRVTPNERMDPRTAAITQIVGCIHGQGGTNRSSGAYTTVALV